MQSTGVSPRTGISSNFDELSRLRTSLADAHRHKAQIDAERPKVLEDFKLGYFCSTCQKAKSEFPSESAFWSHIAEGAAQGRHAVPATQKQTADKEAEFAGKLLNVEKDIQAARDDIQAKEQENRDALDQVSEGVALWKPTVSHHGGRAGGGSPTPGMTGQ